MTDHRSGRPISRRKFLAVTVAALAALLAGAVHRKWEGIQERWEWYRHAHLPLAERIRRHFHYLDLDPDGVNAFVGRYEAQKGEVSFFTPPEPQVFQHYLLSTDFFQHAADESRTVQFIAFFDPYLSPCWNPCVHWT